MSTENLTKSLYGQTVDLSSFADLAKPEDIVRLINGAVSNYREVPGIDLGIVASIVIKSLPRIKTEYDPKYSGDQGTASFTTYAYKRVRWVIGSALKSTGRECFVEAQVKIPRDKREQTQLIRLDALEHIANADGQLELQNIEQVLAETRGLASADTLIDARALLCELVDSIQVTLGLLRVIPFSQPQRAIDIFEGVYGLNGRKKQSPSEAARKWGVSHARPEQIVREIWEKLQIAESPIPTRFEFNSALTKIAHLEEIIGEPVTVTPCYPTEIERLEILARFKNIRAVKANRKRQMEESGYQLNLEAPLPRLAGAPREKMVTVVCHCFGITLEEFKSSSCNRPSKARHVAAFLLYSDLNAGLEDICVLICRNKGMVRHGIYQTARLLKNDNAVVVSAVKVIRRLFENAIKPTIAST